MMDRLYDPDRPTTMKDVIELAALKRTASTLFPLEPITATDQEIHLHVIIPTCCKPDQVEAVAKDVARSLHYSVGGGVKVGWFYYEEEPPWHHSVDVTFSSSAHRDHAVSP